MTLSELRQELPAEAFFPASRDVDFDRMAALARRVIAAPVAMVSLPNQRCQIFPGAAGLTRELDDARQNGLEYSYCQFVVRTEQPLVVPDTREVPELAATKSTTELGLVAYAGMPLLGEDGHAIGSLCVMDDHPRQWTPAEVDLLAELAEVCSSQIRLRLANARAAVTADRDRIARELGQGVIRELFGLSMALGSTRSQVSGPAVAELSKAIDAIDAVIGRIRSSIYDVAR